MCRVARPLEKVYDTFRSEHEYTRRVIRGRMDMRKHHSVVLVARTQQRATVQHHTNRSFDHHPTINTVLFLL